MQSTLAMTMTRRLYVRSAFWTNVALVVAGSLLIAALAQVRVILPFTPVPVTGQTLGVLLVAALLGSRRGASAVALYIAEGAMGLPFFAGGGAGAAYLLGPTGGYLAGFVAAAFVVGWLAERGLDRNPLAALLVFTAGELVIFTLGLTWLSRFVGIDAALAGGLYPFVLGDLVKVALAAALLPSGWAIIRHLTR